MNWMIYGATGFTGKLIVEEAVKRGHKPIIAGRNETKLKKLAEQYDLEYSAFSLDSQSTVTDALKKADVELVMHIAGPFAYTSDVMIQACLATKTHYLDITGEMSVYQNAYRYHQQAEDNGIVIIPGVGFDVVPSDCLLKYVADQVPDATHLEVAFDFRGGMFSRGTQKSGLEIIASSGNPVRRNGNLISVPFTNEEKIVRFMNGNLPVVQNMWGDVVTGYRTTAVPNITTLFALSDEARKQFKFLHMIRPLLKFKFVRNFFAGQVDKAPEGPSEKMQENERVNLYAKATNAKGESAEAWLETCEAYRFTARACIQSIEQVLDGNFTGAMTPAGAFGADFVLGIEDTIRKDSLD